MDQVILDQKLESLRRCIRRVEEKTPSHVFQLIEDQDIQAACWRCGFQKPKPAIGQY